MELLTNLFPIQHCLGKRVFAAYLILPEKQKLNLSFRKEKAQYSFQVCGSLIVRRLQSSDNKTSVKPGVLSDSRYLLCVECCFSNIQCGCKTK